MSRGQADDEAVYSLGAVVKLTGLSAHTIRAWERRYEAVAPARTDGGTRRYPAAAEARLQLLRAGVEAGHRIGDIVGLEAGELQRRLAVAEVPSQGPLAELLAAIEAIDAQGVERLIASQLSILGPREFSRTILVPLLEEIGKRWQRGRLAVAAEHLATSAMRSALGIAMRGFERTGDGPAVLFTTPSGERHELGTLVAAVTALGAGADPIYLGPELPTIEIADAARKTRARAVALGIAILPAHEASEFVGRLRRELDTATALWIGGRRHGELDPMAGVTTLPDMQAVEDAVRALA